MNSTCQKELSLDTQTVLTRARCYLPEGCSSAVPHPRHAMFHSLKLHNNQEPGDGYVPATDLTEFLDEADISEGPPADPMHVENHVGDHMVRGPGDPEKHIDEVNIYMIMSTTLTNPIQDMSNIFRTARLFTEDSSASFHWRVEWKITRQLFWANVQNSDSMICQHSSTLSSQLRSN